MAALFEAHASPVAAQFCAKHCVSAVSDAFQQADQPEPALRLAIQLLDALFAAAGDIPLQVGVGVPCRQKPDAAYQMRRKKAGGWCCTAKVVLLHVCLRARG